MRKIGILTYFWGENEGTFLQAYSMLKAFRRRFPGDRVELVNCEHRRFWFRPHKRDIYPPTLIEHLRRYRIFRGCHREHLDFGPQGIITHDYDRAAAFIEANHYDLVVVGSDTVLEFLPPHVRSGQPPVYWLPPTLACRKVMCAASVGTTTGDSLDGAMRERLAASAQAFDLIGVRDDLSWELMEALGLKGDPRLVRVPDPTFALEIDPGPAEDLARRLPMDLSKPTVGIYLPSGPFLWALVRHCRAQGRQVALFGGRGQAGYLPAAMSPFEWAGIYRHFGLTVTDRFHGTLFSLRYGTPVVALDCGPKRYAPSGFSKTYSLMKEFGLDRTHHLNLDRTRDVRQAIEMVERAACGFDAGNARMLAERMGRNFNAFVDRVAGVLER